MAPANTAAGEGAADSRAGVGVGVTSDLRPRPGLRPRDGLGDASGEGPIESSAGGAGLSPFLESHWAKSLSACILPSAYGDPCFVRADPLWFWL